MNFNDVKSTPISSSTEKPFKRPGWFGVGAVLAAIGASACCIGPLVLLSLGIGGAWMTTLTSMEAVRPVFLIATLVFIGLAFRRLYLVPDYCETGDACASTAVRYNQRILFWVGSGFLIALLAFPWYAPYFIE
ncbi:MAG: mercuric transporter MerT family protein [Pseudomonadales bacterium]|nr:mercuric transporter MerT family protein [Pseudomonadales bacterium]